MNYKRGGVVLAGFPNSNLLTFKPRPALIVEANNVQTGSPQTVVVMITSNLTRSGVTRVFFAKNSASGAAMGLLLDSMVVTDNIVTVEDKYIYKLPGHCPDMQLVNNALRLTLDL